MRAPDAALGQTLRRPRNDPRRVLDRTRIRFSPVAADAPARVRPPRASNLAVRLRHPEQDSVSLLSAHFSSRARPEDSRFPFATVFLTVRGLESIPSQPRSALARIVSRHPRRARGTPPARRDEEARLRASPRASRPPRFEASPTLYAAADPSPPRAPRPPRPAHPPRPIAATSIPRPRRGRKRVGVPASPRPRVPGNLHVPGDVRSHPRVNRVPGVRIRDDVEEHAEGETPAPAPGSGPPTPSPSLAAARLGTPRETPRVRRVARRRPHPARRWRRIERTVEPPRVACHPRESRSRRRSPRRRVRGRRPRRRRSRGTDPRLIPATGRDGTGRRRVVDGLYPHGAFAHETREVCHARVAHQQNLGGVGEADGGARPRPRPRPRRPFPRFATNQRARRADRGGEPRVHLRACLPRETNRRLRPSKTNRRDFVTRVEFAKRRDERRRGSSPSRRVPSRPRPRPRRSVDAHAGASLARGQSPVVIARCRGRAEGTESPRRRRERPLAIVEQTARTDGPRAPGGSYAAAPFIGKIATRVTRVASPRPSGDLPPPRHVSVTKRTSRSSKCLATTSASLSASSRADDAPKEARTTPIATPASSTRRRRPRTSSPRRALSAVARAAHAPRVHTRRGYNNIQLGRVRPPRRRRVRRGRIRRVIHPVEGRRRPPSRRAIATRLARSRSPRRRRARSTPRRGAERRARRFGDEARRVDVRVDARCARARVHRRRALARIWTRRSREVRQPPESNRDGGDGGEVERTVLEPSTPDLRLKKFSSASTPAATPPPKYRGRRDASASRRATSAPRPVG